MDAAPVYDAATLADLQDLFGRERIATMLAGLRREIDERLGSAATDRERIGRDAHALLSVSGTLGFMPLSRACGLLERACMDGGDVSAARADAKAAGEAAQRAIDALIAG